MIRQCNINDLNQMFEIAYRKNNQPEHYTGFCPLSKEGILNEFTEGFKSEDTFYVGYFENECLIGLFGCYIDQERKNVDCIGPFVEGDFLHVAKDLVDYAKTLAGPSMKYTFYFGKNNVECIQLMEAIEAENQGNEFRLILKRENYIKNTSTIPVQEILPKYTDQLIDLHDTIMPDIYISGKGIVNSLGKDRRVFCTLEGDRLIGYSVLKTYESTTNVSVEILAVDKEYRHRGFGRALLNKLLEEALKNTFVEKIDLSVDKVNENALSLYYSMGFELWRENCNYIAQ